MALKEKIKKKVDKNKTLKFIYLRASRIKYKLLKNVSDTNFLSRKYKKVFGRKLDLENPTLYSEKLQWLKIHDRNPRYTTLVDKYLVRDYVRQTIGSSYLNDLYGVYDRFEDINFDALPNAFVIKCNHDSGTSIICKNKESFDFKEAKKVLKLALKTNYFYIGREWPYKNVKPKIIIERFLKDGERDSLIDYKFYCFGGKPTYLLIVPDRGSDTRADYFDMSFNQLDFAQGYPRSKHKWVKPESFEKMKELASLLSKDIPQVRVDFYCIGKDIFFGEMTFFDGGGFAKFEPDDWDLTFGSHIDLKLSYDFINKG